MTVCFAVIHFMDVRYSDSKLQDFHNTRIYRKGYNKGTKKANKVKGLCACF